MPLPEFRVEFFICANGDIPVQEYLNALEINYRAKILAHACIYEENPKNTEA